MVSAASRLFADRPSLTLVHGRSYLHSGFRSLVGAEDDATGRRAGCARWLADDRRRSLLAEIGVGTIDQALMGVLPTRFSTLRLFGLTDRILIVDEAHAYDPYMQRQLETLLKMQAMNGGSAIVMTATLPLEMRQAYSDAFRSGLGCQAGRARRLGLSGPLPLPVPNCARSPLHLRPRRAAASVSSGLTTSTKRLSSWWHAPGMGLHACGFATQSTMPSLQSMLSAQEGVRPISSMPALHLAIGCDTKMQSWIVSERLGDDRAGQVLVATQVVEASLDLDFDVMVSDLAPIGALNPACGTPLAPHGSPSRVRSAGSRSESDNSLPRSG